MPAALVEIQPETHGVALAIAYATADNITGKPVYARAACYLHAEAAARLARAQDLARPLGLGFKIFDAFRPSEAQWKLWEARPDPEFLADPHRGSPHSRGVAVDLTLFDGDG
ncbi:MAG: M15 family metallopeptidase, partial [Acidobacteriota bacterium]